MKIKKHTHILGIGGTFMGGIAILAAELGHKVSGSDLAIYPPMSIQLKEKGIMAIQGYEAEQLDTVFDSIVVGNVMRRGYPVIEAMLNQGLSYESGPEWLAKQVLKAKHVLAVSGTHGKTTTSSMLTWILEVAGLAPGFLIGGIPGNFGISARLGRGSYFVVEADEYDCAFFDKRSKFIHYHPNILIINNIEFDHADIFANLEAIQERFHHLIRTVPGNGLIICPNNDIHVDTVLKKGCWTPLYKMGSDISAVPISPSCDHFEVFIQNKKVGEVKWSLLGEHNIQNALAAMGAALHVGVEPEVALKALMSFKGVKRRLEIVGNNKGITIYDDFAHHPTAIKTTLAGLRAKVGPKDRLIAVVDIRSNTMRAGHHQDNLASSVQDADRVYFFKSEDTLWDVERMAKSSGLPGGVFSDHDALLEDLVEDMQAGDHIICMSNGGFGGLQTQLVNKINAVSV
jgi:UDP-N-acetylmuramate: L-alanyl-gamma-D-glutamyl-meso-diaminopimelate ligase